MKRLTATFKGSVQGVGFRFTTLQTARRYPELTGHVRNCPDGTVELVAEGDEQQLRAFLADIQERMSGYIRSTETNFSPATGEYGGFSVAH